MKMSLFSLKNTIRLKSAWHISANDYSNIGRAMKKIMGRSSKNKQRLFDAKPVLVSKNNFTKNNNLGNPRRISVLNKLFLRHITDLMSTGEYASFFSRYNIEINKVQVALDFNTLNVYWVPNNNCTEKCSDDLLNSIAWKLRHELSTLKLMGDIPIIKFTRDKKQSQSIEVDHRLLRADFGEDYIHTDYSNDSKTQFQLNIPLDLNFKQIINKLDDENSSTENEDLDKSIQNMSEVFLGLCHSEIVNKVKGAMNKAKAKHRRNEATELTYLHAINKGPIEFVSNKEKQLAFKKFLEKQELSRVKAKNVRKNSDIEYIKQEDEM